MPDDNTTPDSAALALHTLANADAGAGITPAPPMILNVFLHGLFAYIDGPDKIEVLLPHLDEHSYRAGEFLGETQIQPRAGCDPYALIGVQGGSEHLDPTKNLTLKSAAPNPRPSHYELHAKLVLPLPVEIFSIRQFDMKPFIDHAEAFTSTVVSTLQVFTYRFDDPEKVSLGDHPFTDAPQTFDGKKYMSLHVFSEEDFQADLNHPMGGFEAAMAIFPELKGKVHMVGTPDELPNITASEIVPGTILPEYEDLRFRTGKRLALIGRRMREGGFPTAWGDGMPPFGSDVTACTNVVVRRG